jgi:NHL repeat
MCSPCVALWQRPRRVQALERDKPAAVVATPLRFPGKLTVHEAGNCMFIADSSNNRIVVASLTGEHICSIGGVVGAGLVDGDFAAAAFHGPQGLAYSKQRDQLFVCDTENHAVRCVDLRSGLVSTMAGNGVRGQDYVGGGSKRAQQLNSPWDVAISADERILYIAMAGQHQIWTLDIASGVCAAFSGTGAEQNLNGDSGRDTAWAQPSGIGLRADGAVACVLASFGMPQAPCCDACAAELGMHVPAARSADCMRRQLAILTCSSMHRYPAELLLWNGGCPAARCKARVACRYVADAESSSIRQLSTSTGGSTLLAGGDALFADNLFQFGDRDGVGAGAELQHPLAIAVAPDSTVYFADSYNHKIRRLAPDSRAVTTVAGSGCAGYGDGGAAAAQFSEPGGLVMLSDGSLLVADTNNSVIRRLTQQKGRWSVSTIALRGVPEVGSRDPVDARERGSAPPGTSVLRLEPVSGLAGSVVVRLVLPTGYHLTAGANSGWEASVSASGPPGLQLAATRGAFLGAEPAATVQYRGQDGAVGVIRVKLATYFCQDNDVCLFDSGLVEIPYKCSATALGAVNADATYVVRKAAKPAGRFAF